MRTQVEVLKRFYELYTTDPNRFFKVSELKIDKNPKVVDRCVSALFSSDFLVLDLPGYIKNLTCKGRAVRTYKLNPEILDTIERIINND